MIIFDSDKDKDWGGKNVLVQHGTLVLLKDANFYHELELHPGKHTVEVFGRKRTGQTLLHIEILDDALKPISEFNLDFSSSFLFNFNFEYNSKSIGYIRFYRPERNYGTLEVVKLIVRNTDLKDDFVLKKDMKKQESERSIISKSKKPKVEVAKEDIRESRTVINESEEATVSKQSRPIRERRTREPENPKETSKELAEESKKENQKTDSFENSTSVTPQNEGNSNEVSKKSSEPPPKRSNKEIPESLAIKLKEREQRLLTRFNKNESSNTASHDADGHVEVAEDIKPEPEPVLNVRDRMRKERELRRDAARNARVEMTNKILGERESAIKESNSTEASVPAAELPAAVDPEPVTTEIPAEVVAPPPSRPPVSSRNILRLSRMFNSPPPPPATETPTPEVSSQDIPLENIENKPLENKE